ncbi:GntR family transcriptional regulator, partial [Rhizobium ruizarguesonis]
MRQASETEVLVAPTSQEVAGRLRRITTAGAIYDRLYADIVSLRLPPGMLLQEKRIADEFGVSSTPVRE